MGWMALLEKRLKQLDDEIKQIDARLDGVYAKKKKKEDLVEKQERIDRISDLRDNKKNLYEYRMALEPRIPFPDMETFEEWVEGLPVKQSPQRSSPPKAMSGFQPAQQGLSRAPSVTGSMRSQATKRCSNTPGPSFSVNTVGGVGMKDDLDSAQECNAAGWRGKGLDNIKEPQSAREIRVSAG